MKNLDLYLNHILEDYRQWMSRCAKNDPYDGRTEIRQKMIEEFFRGIKVVEGKKYLKVITGHSVHSFIVKKDGGKWLAGDILKPASWAAPATNFKRGNILDESFDFGRVRWAGAA